ncbi:MULTISPECIES: magnesium transporter CorA family protein [unclassified Deinococcus]|uniref:magnesium transporter CorA family protein n=1 Tax=unclassified Deinococcus TaxID=2623546 RepID=UPI001C2FDECE|nr:MULTISPECIES: magnesium transporter CorA family protein [unclassified Deinococcus]MDK2011548.1 magnesium transporter CorA family protein [Deinococcus sp. 43]
MLTYHTAVGGQLLTLDTYTDGCWARATAPTPDELARLSRDTGLDLDLLQYPLDPDERSRIERDGPNLLIVLQTPQRLDGSSDIPYDTIPVGILHTPQCLVTICAQDNEVVNDVVRGLVRPVRTDQRSRLTLQILLRAAQRFLIDLRRIDRAIDGAEDRLEKATRNAELLALMRLEKSLVYFKTGLKANELMIERLTRDRLFAQRDDDQEMLDDVLIEHRQAIEMTDISSNILTSTMGTFASIISNNVNGVVRLLTVSTILVNIPTLVTSALGMNVPLPNQDDPRMLPVILGVALGLSGLTALMFRRLGWL